MTAADVVFALLAVATLVSAFFVVTTRNVVRAALWLVVSLGGVAGAFLVLAAELVAWVQVLIYVGAVIVLLLFGLMLTRAPIGRQSDVDSGNRVLAAMVGTGVAGVLAVLLVVAFGGTRLPSTGPAGGSAAVMGAAVFSWWVLPFEVLSVLLLAALVGAIALTRGSGER